MNTTIDFKTATTIENMSRKIDGMERAVSGFFNKMSDIAERKYHPAGKPQQRGEGVQLRHGRNF